MYLHKALHIAVLGCQMFALAIEIGNGSISIISRGEHNQSFAFGLA
jgi:hypothetical protein